MFQRWGFLLGEIWVLLLLAALLGLLAGWLIWGRRGTDADGAGDSARLQAALDACTAKGRDQAARITALEADLASAQSKAAQSKTAEAEAKATQATAAQATAAQATAAASAPAALASAAATGAAVKTAAPQKPAAQKPAAQKTAAQKPAGEKPPATKAAKAPATKGTSAKPATDATSNAATAKPAATKSTTAKAAEAKPATAKAEAAKSGAAKATATKTPGKPKGLTKPRGGKPDDLKLIKGIGPKLEALCHKLGFYHFDQIANWTAAEIAWVDDNLEGFKGRVTREDWVQQARDLMNGLPPRPGGEN